MDETEEQKKEKAREELKKLQEQVRNENNTFDDHGPVIIGDRGEAPYFPEN